MTKIRPCEVRQERLGAARATYLRSGVVVPPEGTNLVLASDIPDVELDVLVGNSLDVETDGGDGGHRLVELELVEDGWRSAASLGLLSGDPAPPLVVVYTQMGCTKLGVAARVVCLSLTRLSGSIKAEHQDAHLLVAKEELACYKKCHEWCQVRRSDNKGRRVSTMFAAKIGCPSRVGHVTGLTERLAQ